jgi:hypothetical protein
MAFAGFTTLSIQMGLEAMMEAAVLGSVESRRFPTPCTGSKSHMEANRAQVGVAKLLLVGQIGPMLRRLWKKASRHAKTLVIKTTRATTLRGMKIAVATPIHRV